MDFYVDYGFASSIYDDCFWKIFYEKGSKGNFHAGALPKTQLVGVGIVDVTGQAAAHIVEEDVAAPLDGSDHVNVAAVAVAGAAGVVVLIIGVHAGAVDGGVLVDQAAVQRCHRHRRLKGGAGGVQALQRAVEHWQEST